MPVKPSILVLLGAFCSCALPAMAVEKTPLVLWYKQPATRWIDAMALGNGRLGAMVFGGVPEERIGLNEDTLWSGGPYEPSTEVPKETREEIKRLMFEGKFKEAQNLSNKLQGTPNSQSSYQTVGELKLEFPGQERVEDYRRELDLDTAIATVTYTADGTEFRREVLSSPADQVIAIRLTANRKGRITFNASQVSPLTVTVKAAEPGYLSMSGRNGDMVQGRDKSVIVPGALTFESRARFLNEGGTVTASGDRISVKDADAVTIYLAAATNFNNYKDVSGNAAERCSSYLAQVVKKPYEMVRKTHVAEHQRLFKRVRFDLGETEASKLPTDERLKNFSTEKDPALVALYFQFGRYLLMSASRPGSQPANLQGIWNDQLLAPWGGKYTVNINTEMNYWPAQVTNLAETEEPLFKMVSEIANDSGIKTARRTYDAGGWVLHHNTDLWRPAAPIDTAFWGQWQTGGAWLAVQLFDSWRFSGDRAYLEKLYPILRESVRFYQDTLVVEPEHGWLVTLPSNSPEHFFQKDTTVSYGPTMDMQILRDLFAGAIEASKVLGKDDDLRGQWVEIRSKLAPNQVGSHGQLQEWIKDWDFNEACDPKHRHMSPFYGVYPGFDITPADAKVFEGARVLAERRDVGGMGWANAWRIGIWARLLDAEKAGFFVDLMITKWTEKNLFDRPAVQLDGNFGSTAGIAEMLLQSHTGEINLLPALPVKKWAEGSITGLRARGGYEVDIAWKEGKLTSVKLQSKRGGDAKVRYAGNTVTVKVPAGGSVTLDGSLKQ